MRAKNLNRRVILRSKWALALILLGAMTTNVPVAHADHTELKLKIVPADCQVHRELVSGSEVDVFTPEGCDTRPTPNTPTTEPVPASALDSEPTPPQPSVRSPAAQQPFPATETTTPSLLAPAPTQNQSNTTPASAQAGSPQRADAVSIPLVVGVSIAVVAAAGVGVAVGLSGTGSAAGIAGGMLGAATKRRRKTRGTTSSRKK